MLLSLSWWYKGTLFTQVVNACREGKCKPVLQGIILMVKVILDNEILFLGCIIIFWVQPKLVPLNDEYFLHPAESYSVCVQFYTNILEAGRQIMYMERILFMFSLHPTETPHRLTIQQSCNCLPPPSLFVMFYTPHRRLYRCSEFGTLIIEQCSIK